MPSPRLKLTLSRAGERAVRLGHPWVYESSVKSQNRTGEAGELAVVYSAGDRFLALGMFDPGSPLRLRVLVRDAPEQIDADWWRRRLQAAFDKRRAWFGPETTGYRLIHGENDGFPGLVLDRYGDCLVLKLYSLAWMPWRDLILQLLGESWPDCSIVGRLSRNIQSAAAESWQVTEGNWRGEAVETALFQENGLTFRSEVLRGQKTGFFLDQRENRERVGEIAAGKSVLNAFSFSGGFSLYGARGGATAVTDLDLSAHALESARENFRLNARISAVARCPHRCVQADAFEYLSEDPEKFDVLVLDPPSLAKREAEKPAALQAYARLISSALRKLRAGGILVAASCSAHVPKEEFFQLVVRELSASRRIFRPLWESDHPQDHPATFPEARYLKCLAAKLGE